jgi:hypothetical protein
MRSGATRPHPHALLQVLLDLSDGTIDHHTGGHHGAAAHAPHSAERATPHADDPDTPSFEAPSPAASGTSLLAALVLLLIVPAQDSRPAWPRSAIRMGHHPGIDPPPPRVPVR